MPGPLEGIKILEFSEIIAGPFAGMLLADMGADIIKVEPPWGEAFRHTIAIAPNESRQYVALNRGKRSLPLDLTRQEAREIVYKLVPEMDVVMVNYRPDVPAKLGIDYETLSTIQPRLIYCENTAFGSRGPHSLRPGSDIVAQAMTGLMAAGGKVQDGVPQPISATALADYATGITMAWGISAALYSRERTGRGQKIEAALMATALGIQNFRFINIKSIDQEALSQFYEDLTLLQEAGTPYEDILSFYQGFRARAPGNIYYRTYQAKDGFLAVGCLSDPVRKRMADVMGLHDIRFEPGYDPLSDEAKAFGEELAKKAEACIREKPVEEWLRLFDPAGVPAGPLKFTEELLRDEHVIANDFVIKLEHPVVGELETVGPILKMSDTPLKAKASSPSLGQHTDAILEELGYSSEEIQRLREQKAVL